MRISRLVMLGVFLGSSGLALAARSVRTPLRRASQPKRIGDHKVNWKARQISGVASTHWGFSFLFLNSHPAYHQQAVAVGGRALTADREGRLLKFVGDRELAYVRKGRGLLGKRISLDGWTFVVMKNDMRGFQLVPQLRTEAQRKANQRAIETSKPLLEKGNGGRVPDPTFDNPPVIVGGNNPGGAPPDPTFDEPPVIVRPGTSAPPDPTFDKPPVIIE